MKKTYRNTSPLVQLFVPIARELAAKAKKGGITAANLYHAGVQRGYFTNEEKELRWLAGVFRHAGLVKSGAMRPSDVPRAHRRPQTVWVLPEYAPDKMAEAAKPRRAVDILPQMKELGWAVLETPGRFGGTQFTATYEARTEKDYR